MRPALFGERAFVAQITLQRRPQNPTSIVMPMHTPMILSLAAVRSNSVGGTYWSLVKSSGR